MTIFNKPKAIIRTTWFDRFVLFLCGGFFFGTLHQAIESGIWSIFIFPLIASYVCLSKAFAVFCNGHSQDNGRAFFYDSDVHRIRTSNAVAKILSSAFGLYVGKFDGDSIEHMYGDYYIGLFFQDGQICKIWSRPVATTSCNGPGASAPGVPLPSYVPPPPYEERSITALVPRGEAANRAVDTMLDTLKNGAELVDECGFNKIRIPQFSSPAELKMKLQLLK